MPGGGEEEIVAGVAAFDLAGAGAAEVGAGLDDALGGDGGGGDGAGCAAAAENGNEEGLGGGDAGGAGEELEEDLLGGIIAADAFDLEGDFERDGGAEDVVEIDLVADAAEVLAADDALGEFDFGFGGIEALLEALERRGVGFGVTGFDEESDGRDAGGDGVDAALAGRRGEDAIDVVNGGVEDERWCARPAFGWVEEDRGPGGDALEADGGELFGLGEVAGVEDLELEVGGRGGVGEL